MFSNSGFTAELHGDVAGYWHGVILKIENEKCDEPDIMPANASLFTGRYKIITAAACVRVVVTLRGYTTQCVIFSLIWKEPMTTISRHPAFLSLQGGISFRDLGRPAYRRRHSRDAVEELSAPARCIMMTTADLTTGRYPAQPGDGLSRSGRGASAAR